MLKESKFFRYSLYATGEITLVVIGILFAVQIDGWNTNKEQIKNNRIHLEQLIQDLDKDKTRLMIISGDQHEVTGDRIAVANCDTALKLSYKGLDSTSIDYLLNLSFYGGGTILGIEDGVCSELVNTAKLYSIGSDSLIRAIKSYYTTAKKEDYYNKLNSTQVDIYYRNNVDWLRILRERMYSEDFSISDYKWLYNSESEEYLLFQENLGELKHLQISNLNKAETMLNNCEELRNQITKELAKKE